MIEATDLTKNYGKVRALDGLSFEVSPGTIFGLLGPNGAGKSTTVKLLTTLARPDSGKASVAGHDVRREPAEVRRAIGVVAQRSGMDRDLTGRENVKLQGQLQGMRGRELDCRTDELLEQLGLPRPLAGWPAPTRAGCSGGWTSRSGWSTARGCCSSTSPRPGSTPRFAPPCGRRSGVSRRTRV